MAASCKEPRKLSSHASSFFGEHDIPRRFIAQIHHVEQHKALLLQPWELPTNNNQCIRALYS